MILRGQDIVCLSPMPWTDWFWTSRHYIMDQFARNDNRVLFVNPGVNVGELALTRLSRRHRPDLRQAVQRLHTAGGLHRVHANLWTVTYLYLPRFSFARFGGLTKLLDNLNAGLLGNALRRSLRSLGFGAPILWNSFMISWAVQAIDRMAAKLIVYHCTDEFSTEDPRALAQLVEWETQMLRKAHLVFTVSPTLHRERRRLNANTYLIPHGVSADLVAAASDASGPAPDDAARIPRPRLGVVGMVSANYDLALLAHVAKSRKGWSLVIVGPVDAAMRGPLGELLEEANVHWLGPKAAVDLAGYLRCLDVGLMPYRSNRQTAQASNPLKLLQYLAAGLPVVCTDMQQIQQHAEPGTVACTSSASSFVRAIDKALMSDSPKLRRERINIARQSTWERRVADMSEIISHHLSRLHTPSAA